MNTKNIWMGNTPMNHPSHQVEGGFITIDGEEFYQIKNFDLMPDFFMTIVSDVDHWMFLSSNGSLSAGRKDRDNALFPYYTDDKIHDYCGITGSKTLVQVHKDDRSYLWEPFSKALKGFYSIERRICKSVYANKIIFQETNHDLGLTFEYGWYNSDRFGFVKKSKIINHNEDEASVTVLDGMSNILPNGSYYDFQNAYSNLLDGYKKTEQIAETGLALYLLSAIPVDRAEPSESLSANIVWATGLGEHKILLSDNQLDAFRHGADVVTEFDVKGTRGAFYVVTDLALAANAQESWMAVAELNLTSTLVANMNNFLLENRETLIEQVNADIAVGTAHLKAIIASADGLQATSQELIVARHFSNTLYNVMRGGIYLDQYQVEKDDFVAYLNTTNTQIAAQVTDILNTLPAQFTKEVLVQKAVALGNATFLRICYEYLPLTFSRRHGDPSRPWNLFNIVIKNEDGTAISDYQGNWRDIFQNWEALSLSFPNYIDDIICKFVNATTADGYNPYRIMKDGIDWEAPDPEDSWSYIGYWGDHQIIYLQKLLEQSNQYHPRKIDRLLSEDIFVYANVPYRIKSYEETVVDPQNTIDFDDTLDAQINAQVETLGADARLVQSQNGGCYHVNLTEKILVTMLVKLSNFIPEAGIWMNTQRPEWNDANNALVGNGASMVTLCYLRRFLHFWEAKFGSLAEKEIPVSVEVQTFFAKLQQVFAQHAGLVDTGFSDQQRLVITDALGKAGSDYRLGLYANSFAEERATVKLGDLAAFCGLTKAYMEQSIRANRRDDGLYHAYNLVSFNADGISIRYLYEMLEGQVAVLSTGYLNGEEVLAVLNSLKASKLFRADQFSYLLYPDRELPRYNEKNNIPAEAVQSSQLLQTLLQEQYNPVIRVDDMGGYHFSSKFNNANFLANAMETLDKAKYGDLLAAEKEQVLAIYEEMFDHKSYTGRSGTFYAYEGLGSIYWHMVSKLRLAVNECFFQAVSEGVDASTTGQIKAHYFEIKAGIGLYKSPEIYGAFPTDAYSHTVRDAGVKQPGMTGQVKEDVIARMTEVGVHIGSGEINFETRLLNQKEILEDTSVFSFINIAGKSQDIELCAESEGVRVSFTDGTEQAFNKNNINADISRKIFSRTGEVMRIDVSVVL